MAIEFTQDQQEVIDTRHKNILVSAAAGSGKTAVLVERIVRLVCDEGNGIDIDELLVVTFTKAAAAEMRERICKRISEELEKKPESEHLRKQYALVHRAMITTIDAFCTNVLRNHFHDIGIDPDFRVMDEGERQLMRIDVLSDLLEEKYEEQDEAFIAASMFFAPTGEDDSEFEECILELQEYSESFAWPDRFLEERKNDHRDSYEKLTQNAKDDPMGKYFLKYLKGVTKGYADKYDELVRLCDMPGGPAPYRDVIEAEAANMRAVSESSTALETAVRISEYQEQLCARLPACKGTSFDPVLKNRVTKTRTLLKNEITGLREKFFSPDLKSASDLSDKCAPYMETLIDITIEFRKKFLERKSEEHVVDFGDLEHFALDILVGEDGKPSPVALEYRDHFKEIMVDEYQDSNLVQDVILDAIASKTEGSYDRFMVGDVKQSIYGFRQARPDLFLEKYNSYPDEEGCKRIDLSKNFRSRKEVIDSVNEVFEKVMHTETGGIEYDSHARLYPGAVYPEGNPGDFKTELILFDKDILSGNFSEDMEDEEADGVCHGAGTDAATDDDGPGEEDEKEAGEYTSEELEAKVLAHLVRELVGTEVTDRVRDENGEERLVLRPAGYRDIVILHRSPAKLADALGRIFEKESIPVSISQGGGYFSVTEIRQVMQLLRVINNPLAEIPMYGVLVSVFGGYSPDRIGRLRADNPGMALYDAVKKDLPEFAGMIEKYRRLSICRTVRELLQIIFDDHDYLEYVTALPAGAKRRANVEMLLSYASAYEKTSYFGLYHFVRYIDQLEKYTEDRTSEADVLGESADVVRFMSVHKSKGLEFPITILAGMGKKFNFSDTRAKLVHDNELGLGHGFIDPEKRISTKTLRHELISRKLTEDTISEELRLLYVAMTRAKEKLIMVGRCKKASETLENALNESTERLGYSDFIKAASYLDIVLPVIGKCPTVECRVLEKDDLLIQEEEDQVLLAGRKQELEQACLKANKEELELISRRIAYEYPHRMLEKLYTKTTVSELKMAAMEQEDEEAAELFESREKVEYIPEFRQTEKKTSGTVRGNAYHRVMEIMDYDRCLGRVLGGRPESYASFREKMDGSREVRDNVVLYLREELRDRRISEEYYNVINVNRIMDFLGSELAYRMWSCSAAGKLFREQPFVLSLPANRLNPDFPDSESVLIQGIIDAYFIENDKVVLLDYKTDSLEEDSMFVSRYKAQIDYYQEAIEKLTGLPVAERLLYSFHLSRRIMC